MGKDRTAAPWKHFEEVARQSFVYSSTAYLREFIEQITGL